MKKFIFIGILAFIFHESNPSKEEFNFFIQEELRARVSSGNSLADGLVAGFLNGIISESTIRKNHYIFSRYIIDMSGLKIFRQDLPNKIEVIGVAGIFIPLTEF